MQTSALLDQTEYLKIYIGTNKYGKTGRGLMTGGLLNINASVTDHLLQGNSMHFYKLFKYM